MASLRYSGWIGVASQSEVAPGVWEETLAFMPVLGTVKQTTEVLEGESDILPRYRTTTSISVVARGIGYLDNSDIRVITHKGKNWQIASIVDDPPEIVVFMGEEYHGEAAG
jgi:hypothetical protein